MALEFVTADFENQAHREAIPAMINAYASDPMGRGEGLHPEILERIVPAMERFGGAVVLLAMDGDEPVGIANCQLGFSSFAARPVLNIHDLAVVPSRRGEGIGRKLLEQAEAKGRELECCKLTLEVLETNTRARALYDRFGFGDYSTGSNPIPTYFLEKSLG